MRESDYPRQYLYKRIVQAKLFMDIHFNSRISLEAVCREASFSKFHFLRLFKIIYGKTPHQYLTGLRIAKAKDLLLSFGVTEVCDQVGFESISSFTALFRRNEGVSPSEYRKRMLLRNMSIHENPLQYIPHCFLEPK